MFLDFSYANQFQKDATQQLAEGFTAPKNDSRHKSTIRSHSLKGSHRTCPDELPSSASSDLTALPKQKRTSSRSITIRSEYPDLPITPPPSSPSLIKSERQKRSRSVRCTECRSKEVRYNDFEFCRLVMCGLCGPRHCLKPETCPEIFKCEHMFDQGDILGESPRSSIRKGKSTKKVVRWADRAVKRCLEEDGMETDLLPKPKKKKLEMHEPESESEYHGVSATESEEL